MGNCVTTEPSVPESNSTLINTVVSYYTACYTSCFQHCITISIEETDNNDKKAKDKYQNYTDEIAITPTYQPFNLELAYVNCTHENTPVYGYENLKKLVKILRVIDGDTLDIALHHDEAGKIFKHRIRLYGIDTPEKHPPLSNPERNKEIEASKKAHDALAQRLKENDNLVIALFHKFDKYGRLMATFYDKQGEDINKWMITSGYAQEYFGKTKKKFEEPKTLMVSECDIDYFETPRKSESAPKEVTAAEIKDDEFEEFPEEITEEAKNDIRIV